MQCTILLLCKLHLYSCRNLSPAQVTELTDEQPYQLPALADSILDRGFELVGTQLLSGRHLDQTGFDCSGFVGYLFREEAGIKLPRSTREMINLDAPLVSRTELEPGDIVFFNNRGRGRVSHAGIYIDDDQFIHSSSSRSGGVRVDSLMTVTGVPALWKPSVCWPRHRLRHNVIPCTSLSPCCGSDPCVRALRPAK